MDVINSQPEEKGIEKDFIIAKGALDTEVLPFLLEQEGRAPRQENSSRYFADSYGRDLRSQDDEGLFSSEEKVMALTTDGEEVQIPKRVAHHYGRRVKLTMNPQEEKRNHQDMIVVIKDYNNAYFPFDNKRKLLEISRYAERNNKEFDFSAFDQDPRFGLLQSVGITYDKFRWIYKKCIDSNGNHFVSMSYLIMDDELGRWRYLKDNVRLKEFKGDHFDRLREMIENRAFYSFSTQASSNE